MISVALAVLGGAARAQDAPKEKLKPLEVAFSATDRTYVPLRFSPDGKLLATGGPSFIRLFALDPFKEAKNLSQRGRVNDVFFDSTGRALVSRSSDEDVTLWDVQAGFPLKFAIDSAPAEGPIRDGKGFALPKRIKGVQLWRTDGVWERRRAVLRVDLTDAVGVLLQHVLAVGLSTKDLFLGDDEGYLVRIPLDALEPRRTPPDAANANPMLKTPGAAHVFRPHSGEFTSLSLASDGALCLTSGTDGKVKLWNLSDIPVPTGRRAKDPEPRWSIAGHTAALSDNGRVLAVADAKGVCVYETETGKPLSWMETGRNAGRAVRLRFSPDGRFLAAILCRCDACGQGESFVTMKKRLEDHGGPLVIWK